MTPSWRRTVAARWRSEGGATCRRRTSHCATRPTGRSSPWTGCRPLTRSPRRRSSPASRYARAGSAFHDAHALELHSSGSETRMANPFSTVPTAYRVHTPGGWWCANCAWDAFGVCAALRTDDRIETSCPDCAAPLAVDVRSERPDDASLLFHCLVPAAMWWRTSPYLKHDESLPVERARGPLARRAPARRDHPGNEAEPARARLVGRPAVAALAAAHA